MQCEDNFDISSPYKVDMMNVLVNSGLFTHSADTEQH